MAAEGPAGNREGRAPFPTNAKLKAIFGHAAVITVVEKSSLLAKNLVEGHGPVWII